MKRSLALLLVAIMVVSNLSGLTLPARAVENDSVEVSVGEIVAGNYDLTEAEKALLESGYLVGGSFTYTAPTNSGLITLDTDEKRIEVATYTDDQGNVWIATAAGIYVGNEKKEDVVLDHGVGYYTYGENAFSVKVTYTLRTEIEESLQATLLNAPAALKNALANIQTVRTTDANLGVIASSMDVLRMLADGIDLGWASAEFGEDAKAAVAALEAQIAQFGELELQKMIALLDSYAFESAYLASEADMADFLACLENTYACLNNIKADALMNNALLDSYLQNQEPASYTQWMAMKNILGNTVTALEEAMNGDWSLLNAQVIELDADYAELDALINNIGATTTVDTIKNPLLVAEATVTLNMSMFNVGVTVVLKTVQNNEVRQYGAVDTTLTLAEGATKAEILAAVEAMGFVNTVLGTWEAVYVEEHFDRTETALPETLTEDISYVITFSPKFYEVTFSYAAAQTLPYGHELVLPRHENPAEAYDYSVNGVPYAQGSTYTVVGDTNITRSAGKAYTGYDLYAVIAGNYGDAALQAIMNSGALFGNVTVNVRKPDPADAESLVTLVNGQLTAAEAYESDYAGLVWVPYSYGVNGDENLFNGNYTVEWTGASVKVQYILVLSNYTANDVRDILDTMVALKTEANAQVNTLNALAANYDAMGQLDKTKLGALNGVIGVTDFTPGDGTDTDAENLRLRDYFSEVVGEIIANNVASNNYLKIYNMLGEYRNANTGGLTYYYNNSAALIAEIDSLSSYLTDLVNEEEALRIMVSAAGFPEYADKIMDLEESMANVKAALTAPNALIDLSSPNLYKLIEALEDTGAATYTTPGSPFIKSEMLTALDETTAIVQVIVSANGQSQTFTSPEFAPGTILTQGDVNELIAAVEAFAAQQLGNKIGFYKVTGLEELQAMVGAELSSGRVNMYVDYEAIQYTIIIDGMGQVVVDINNLQVILPAHETTNFVYVYTVFNREITVGQSPVSITLTADELASIAGDTYTITWYDYNKAEADVVEKLENMVDKLQDALGAGNVQLNGDVLNVDMSADQLMDFVMTLVMDGGYSYYGLNGQGFIYMNEENVLQMSMQTMLNAIFLDEGFTSANLIALGNNGSGTLLSASLQLGDSATVLDYNNLELVINLTSIPGAMKTALSVLDSLSSYMRFYANNGVLEVELNLPDQVYGAYLTALVATGNADKADINTVNQQIALQFLCDYMNAIINSGADMATLENTLAMLGMDLSLEQYNAYYKMLADSLGYTVDENGMFMELNLEGKKTIDNMLSTMGMAGQFDTYLGMIAEHKDGAYINIPANVTLNNADRDYCALILDVNAAGVTNKFACIRTGDWAKLNNKTSAISGYAVIILLDDVQGDLKISGTTILDLNGHNVTGTIKSTGNVFIIDSSMDTYNAGVVNDVSGNITIIGGNYLSEVSSFVKDGYYMDGTTVRNAMYHIEADANGNVTFVINSDVYKSEEVNGYVPNLTAMALDMAIDLLLNYATTAGLTINGNTLYDVAFTDLVGLLESRSGRDAINMLLATVSDAGFSGFLNDVIADLIDFETIYEALENNTNIAQYDFTVAPWMVAVERTAEDYLTLSILSNPALAETFALSLRIEGNSMGYVKDLAYEMAQIVEQNKTGITVTIDWPDNTSEGIYVSAAGSAVVSVDMSNNANYAKFFAIILAYGNSSKAAAVVEAIKNDNMAALKDVVDNTSVAQLFTALKAMSRGTGLLAMARAIGLDTADLGEVAELEQVFHLLLVAAGKSLEELNITGMNSKLGHLYNEATGYYELNKSNMFRDGELTARGYSASYELSIIEVAFNLKMFGDVGTPGHQHQWSDWAVYTPGDCLTDTVMYRECACGEVEYDVIAAPGHNYQIVDMYDPLNCEEAGYIIFTCHCGDTYTEIIPAGEHDWVKVDEHQDCTNSSYVVWECSVCGEIDVRYSTGSHQMITIVHPATCTEVGCTVELCIICGYYEVYNYIDPIGHNYQFNPNLSVPATCTTAGYATYECANCGDSYTRELPALEHNYGEWYVVTEPTCTEVGIERRDCKRCYHFELRDIEALGHSYEAVVTDPTCTEAGYTTYTCHCGDTYVADFVDALGHSYVPVVTEPTCTEQGYTTYTCSVCGDTYVADYVDALGHSYEVTDSLDATCTEDGYITYTCSVCGDTYTDVVPATGHSYEAVVTEPTCTEEGFTTYTCSACGDTYVADFVDALGHSYEAVVTAPTCTEDGYTTYTCSVCGDSYVADYMEALGHNYETVVTEPTCTEAGYTTYTCSVCGDTFVTDYVDALGHSYEAFVTDPTCTEQGYTTYICSVCGDTYTDSYVDTLEHEMGEWQTVTDATCTENGEEIRYCQSCDYSETRVVEAYGHSYEAVVTDPTCTEQGYTTYTCTICGHVEVADYVDVIAHAWGEWVVVKEPQCYVAGVKGEKQRTCSVCGEVESVEMDTTDHVFVDGVCKWCGYEEGTNPPTGMAAIGGMVFLVFTAAMGFVVLIVRRKKLLN